MQTLVNMLESDVVKFTSQLHVGLLRFVCLLLEQTHILATRFVIGYSVFLQ